VVGSAGGLAVAARWSVVITDSDYADTRIEAEVLAAVPGGVALARAACPDGRGLAEAAAGADGLLVQHCPLSAEALAALPRCRVVARYGVGFDAVDVAAATARGICVCNVPDYAIDEVSDHALALLLGWARGVVALDRAVRAGEWDWRAAGPIHRLRGRVLGLVGFGRIARALAAKAAALGLRVLAHDPLVTAEAVRAAGVEPAGSLDRLLAAADFVSVHVPLHKGTRGLLGAAQLRRMRPGALLINTARGAVVDEDALARALREGWIAGAALDVLAQEPPPPGHPLAGLPNLILTPHVAWYSEESEAELRRRAARNVAAVLSGRRPPHLVNPEAWPRG
jgi:D-3-phosphoglycerate dehydrogenase